jgi:hypothetical protein
MRYYEKSSGEQRLYICIWGFNVIVGTIEATHQKTIWNLTFVVMSLIILIVEIVDRRVNYFEVGDVSLIKRYLWRREVHPYAEITYVGPPARKSRFWNWSNRQIEVRSHARERSIFMPANTKPFLADLHNHLTEEVFHFSQTPS